MTKKKIGIGLLVILGLAIIGLAIIKIFFPGLPFYLFERDKYPKYDIRVEEFKNYDLKDTSGMEKIQMEGYSVYLPKEFTFLKKAPVGSKTYKNKEDNTTHMLTYLREPDNTDYCTNEEKEVFKDIYGKQPYSQYEWFYMYNCLSWDNYKITSKYCPKVYKNNAKITLGASSIQLYDNGKIKAVILKRDKQYQIEIYSIDDTKWFGLVLNINGDEQLMSKILNSVELE